MNKGAFNENEMQEGVRTSLNCLQFVAFVARQLGHPQMERDAYCLHDAMLMQLTGVAGQGVPKKGQKTQKSSARNKNPGNLHRQEQDAAAFL